MAKMMVRRGTGKKMMVPPRTGAVTPQAKNIYVNDKLGNPGIKTQQGTMRWLYHVLPLDGRTEFRFFDQVNPSAGIGFTNIDSINGLLGPGESMVVKYLAFSVNTFDPVTGQWTGQVTPAIFGGGFSPQFYTGTWEFWTSNTRTSKPASNIVFDPTYNIEGQNQSGVYEIDVDQVIPPLLPWFCVTRTTVYTAIADTYLKCIIGGPGSILNTKTTY